MAAYIKYTSIHVLFSLHLTWQWFNVATPYKKTKSPTKAAGKSIPVYQPNQAKYKPIFSPKYRLSRTQGNKVMKTSLIGLNTGS